MTWRMARSSIDHPDFSGIHPSGEHQVTNVGKPRDPIWYTLALTMEAGWGRREEQKIKLSNSGLLELEGQAER